MPRTFYIGHSAMDDRVCTECGEMLAHLDERCPACSGVSPKTLRDVLEEHKKYGSNGVEVWMLALD